MSIGIKLFQNSGVLFKILQIRKKAFFFMKLLFIGEKDRSFFFELCQFLFKGFIGWINFLKFPFELSIDFISWFYNSHNYLPKFTFFLHYKGEFLEFILILRGTI